MEIKKIFGLYLLAGMLMANVCAAHPFHTTTAEMEFNASTKRFEVSLKVPAADYEHMVRAGAMLKEKVLVKEADLNDGTTAKSARDSTEKSVARYIENCFTVTVAGKPCRFEWVGMEDEQLNKWFYFELVPAEEQLGSVSLVNKICFDANVGQINTVVFIANAKRVSVKTHEQISSVPLPDVHE